MSAFRVRICAFIDQFSCLAYSLGEVNVTVQLYDLHYPAGDGSLQVAPEGEVVFCRKTPFDGNVNVRVIAHGAGAGH